MIPLELQTSWFPSCAHRSAKLGTSPATDLQAIWVSTTSDSVFIAAGDVERRQVDPGPECPRRFHDRGVDIRSWAWPWHTHVVVRWHRAGVHDCRRQRPQEGYELLCGVFADCGHDRRGKLVGLVLDALSELDAGRSDAPVFADESTVGEGSCRCRPFLVVPPAVRSQALLGRASGRRLQHQGM